jgi:hypothetical protein
LEKRVKVEDTMKVISILKQESMITFSMLTWVMALTESYHSTMVVTIMKLLKSSFTEKVLVEHTMNKLLTS